MILLEHEYHVVELQDCAPPTVVWDWLLEQFGSNTGERWFYKHPKIYFANAQDHLLFVLKWS